MMRFARERWERQFQLSFNRGCFRTDLLYSICLAAFGLAALYRLQSVPGATATSLATAAVPAFTLLLLMMTSLWPAVYVQHRQPIAAVMKIWTAFVVTLLPVQQTGTAAGSGTASSGGVQGTPGEALVHAGAGFAMQLALHALGLQTTGAWLVVSQGFAVAASARVAALTCDVQLAAVMRDFLAERPGLLTAPLVPAAVAGADPALLCKAYVLGMQVLVGFCLATSLGLVAEWRQRREFADKHDLEPPGTWDLLAAAGSFLAMLCLLVHVALTAALPPQEAVCGGGGNGACSGAAEKCGGGTCAASLEL